MDRRETVDVTYPDKEVFDDGATVVEVVYEPGPNRFEVTSSTCPWALYYYNAPGFEWLEFVTTKEGTGLCFE